MLRGTAALLGAIAVLLLSTGCARDSDDGVTDASPTVRTTGSPTAGSESPVATVPKAEVRGFPENTAPQSGQGAAPSNLVLVDVRVTSAERFDRIVLEFTGTGTPGWVVNYVDKPVLDGSGVPVDLGGRATLDIYASETTWPAPDYYDGPSQFTPEQGGDVTEVYVGGTFEGTTQVLAGIHGAPVPFRAFTLTAPSRLVIDVRKRGHENAD